VGEGDKGLLGDDGAGKAPIPSFPFLFSSFSAKAGNPEIQLEKKATHPPQWDGLKTIFTTNNHF